MKGSFASTVSTALFAFTSTVTAASSTSDLYGVAYNLQTGTILYASMPLLPPSSISATDTSPLYPTSSASIATTFLGAPTISTTYTQTPTYSFASHANTASAAANPTDDGSDMAKYLRRWKDDE